MLFSHSLQFLNFSNSFTPCLRFWRKIILWYSFMPMVSCSHIHSDKLVRPQVVTLTSLYLIQTRYFWLQPTMICWAATKKTSTTKRHVRKHVNSPYLENTYSRYIYAPNHTCIHSVSMRVAVVAKIYACLITIHQFREMTSIISVITLTFSE